MFLPKLSRRDLLIRGTTLSAAGLGLLAGMKGKAFAGDDMAAPQDIDVLNEILGTEHEGIAAYRICITNKILHKDMAKTGQLFQGHHEKHRDLLIEKIIALGGTPNPAKKLDEYANDLDTVNLKSQSDALKLIAGLERSAANAYIGMLPSTNDHELVKLASRIAADEVLHWTAFSSLLHAPLPSEALSFGA